MIMYIYVCVCYDIYYVIMNIGWSVYILKKGCVFLFVVLIIILDRLVQKAGEKEKQEIRAPI